MLQRCTADIGRAWPPKLIALSVIWTVLKRIFVKPHSLHKEMIEDWWLMHEVPMPALSRFPDDPI